MGTRVGRDGEYEYDLSGVGHFIRGWKSSYFRKNSAKPAKIQLRCNHSSDFTIAWKYFLEIWVGSKLHDQVRIQEEAYDVYNHDPDCKKTQHNGFEFILIHEFTPLSKNKPEAGAGSQPAQKKVK